MQVGLNVLTMKVNGMLQLNVAETTLQSIRHENETFDAKVPW